jgi:hypothetical protein
MAKTNLSTHAHLRKEEPTAAMVSLLILCGGAKGGTVLLILEGHAANALKKPRVP